MENKNRRKFIRQSIMAGTGAVITLPALEACGKKSGDSDEEVSPGEDLMREHGVLNRILLVYDHCIGRLSGGEEFPLSAITAGATIIRKFIENYHEKQEEDYLFPRFEKANTLKDLVTVLRQQHDAGRAITDKVLHLSRSASLSGTEKNELVAALKAFNTMYRPHEAREDTVLFPALRKIVSKNEYDSLGEDFEKREHELFGEDGFESMVGKVAEIETSLGIYDLNQFTPDLK